MKQADLDELEKLIILGVFHVQVVKKMAEMEIEKKQEERE
jgi:hypothetical protein